jgi:hypothetical protein
MLYYIGFVVSTRNLKLKKSESPNLNPAIKLIGKEKDILICSFVAAAESKAQAVRDWAAIAPNGAVLRFLGAFEKEKFDGPSCQEEWLEKWAGRKIHKT